MQILGWVLLIVGIWGALGFIYQAARPRSVWGHSRANILFRGVLALGMFGGPGLWLIVST